GPAHIARGQVQGLDTINQQAMKARAQGQCQDRGLDVALGIGASSPTIVTSWNAVPFEKPYARVRDTIRFLRAALAGEKVTAEYETFSVQGFRLDVAVPEMPPILVGALRPQMLRLAGQVLAEGPHVAGGGEGGVGASLPVQTHGQTNFLKLHRVGESHGYTPAPAG
ncbi:MAG TPA: LLM class flavin-dependent oxidoreductase, partial [Tepidiformaceae bacterium]|nr:LLM class flavin-dependent oxidoreductase [Tepidiformaceae bacterium]